MVNKFAEHLVGSKVAACTGHRGGHQGCCTVGAFPQSPGRCCAAAVGEATKGELRYGKVPRGGGAEKGGGVLLGAAAPLDTCTDESNGLATATSAHHDGWHKREVCDFSPVNGLDGLGRVKHHCGTKREQPHGEERHAVDMEHGQRCQVDIATSRLHVL
jgi:hypothetical protein